MRCLRSLRSDHSGAAIIELALSATVLATMIAGVADISSAYSRKLALEQAAQRAIEKQMQTTGIETPEGTLKSEAIAQAGNGLTADKITVTYTRNCNGAKQDDYNDECEPTEITTRYLSIRIYDDYSPILPITFGTMTAEGKYRVSAEAGLRIQ